jgi:Flp pilus assembly protein TadG
VTPDVVVARPAGGPPPTDRDATPPAPAAVGDRVAPSEAGAVSLEAVFVLPVLALLILSLLEVGGLVRDVLVAHEAARAGARAAATTTGSAPVVAAARAAAPEIDVRVEVVPVTRRDGDLARVTVVVQRRFAGTSVPIRATALARVEPAVGTMPSGSRSPGRSPPGTGPGRHGPGTAP